MSRPAPARLLSLTLAHSIFPGCNFCSSVRLSLSVVQIQFTAKMLACTVILTGVHDPFQPKVAVPKEDAVPTISMAAATPASAAAGAPVVAARPSVLPPPRGSVPIGGMGGMGTRPFSTPAAKPEIEEAEDEFDDDE